MAKEELVIGFKNALERGQSLQSAVQAYLAAGYDPKDIQEAAAYVNTGIIEKTSVLPKANSQQSSQSIPTIQAQQKKKMKKSVKILIWAVSILALIVILLGVLGPVILNSMGG